MADKLANVGLLSFTAITHVLRPAKSFGAAARAAPVNRCRRYRHIRSIDRFWLARVSIIHLHGPAAESLRSASISRPDKDRTWSGLPVLCSQCSEISL